MIRVASVPSGHVYVRHLAAPGDDAVVRLPDPPPPNAASQQQWWPPVMLDSAWVEAHHGDFDIFHLHFGFDAQPPARLRELVDLLRRHRKPFVYTVHDLRNPHQADPATHAAALDVLVPGADALITLTHGAAEEVWRRWGRLAHVVAHPHVVPLESLGRPRPVRERRRVGVHLKSLRAGMNPLPVLRHLPGLCRQRSLELVIDVHTDVMTRGTPNHDPVVQDLLTRLADRGEATVHVHDYYSDDELWEYFRSLDLSVLPYRFGTHSGWLEACFDLGTRVLAPRLGHYHHQAPGVLGYRVVDDEPDPADLAAALDVIAGEPVPWQAHVGWRREQRAQVAAAHLALYETLMAAPR